MTYPASGTLTHIKRQSLNALLLLLAAAAPLWAQQGKISFKVLGLEQGLSQNSVRAVLQDSMGFMWFGTQEGLNLYDGYHMTVFHHDPEAEDSLSGNYAYSLMEDRNGVIWVGTWDAGLNRYNRDTQNFDHFVFDPANPNNPKAPSSNRVWSLTQDATGIIWLGTGDGGINRFNPATGIFEHDRHNPTDPNSIGSDSIREVMEDSKGRIWVGTRGAGLALWDRQSGHYKQYRHNPDQPGSLASDRIYSLMEHSNGSLWVATEGGGLDRFDPHEEVFYHHQFHDNNPHGVQSNRVTDLIEDRFGRIWTGSVEAGLSFLDPQTGRFTHFPHKPANPDSFSSNFIYTLFKDDSGLIWAGTEGGGANRFDPAGSGFNLYRHIPGDDTSLSNNKIFPISQDSSGTVWIGTQEGGLNRFDLETRTFSRVPVDTIGSLNEPQVYSVLEDNYGHLWIGTDGGGLQRFDSTSNRFKAWAYGEAAEDRPISNQVYSLAKDGQDHLLMGTIGDGFGRLDLNANHLVRFKHNPQDPRSLSHDRVISFFRDRQGRLWVGTLGGGLNLSTPGKDGFEHHTYDRKNPRSVGGNMAFAFHEDKAGELWIATNGGLSRFDPNTNRFKTYRTKHGLPNNVIYGILPGDDGRYWMSTNRGISSMDPQTETFINYDSRDGLQSDEFNFAAFFKHKSGELFFGGIDGLNTFFPSSLSKSNYVPPIVLTNLLIKNRPVLANSVQPKSPLSQDITMTDSFTLNHTQNMFTLEFAALDFTMPGRNQYAYQLEGYDEEWVVTEAENRRATYTNLPEGTYSFKVKGSNHDGVWNSNVRMVQIKILSHPLLSWWAKSVYLALVILLIGSYIRMQRRSLIKERKISQRLRQVDRLREEFLANTSHELRTPLHGMIGLAEAVIATEAQNELALESRENLTLIIASGKRLANLVNDLLDFSKLNNRTLELHVRTVDPRSVAEVVLELTKPLVIGKSLELNNQIAIDGPHILADENRLMQIFHNLVGNAVKFTQTGSVTISSEVMGDELAIHISDSGIGIPEDKFEQIFQSFEQAEGGIAREYGGTGLGLAVTRKLVELQEGRIWVTSKLGEGSTFTFTLPIAPAGFQDHAPAVVRDTPRSFVQPLTPERVSPQPNTAAGERNSHILIVDDEPVNRRVLVNHLARENYRITQAGDGFEAIAALEQDHFDLVLLDVMMPKMTGYEVCAKLRTRFPLHDLPVIFLTARNQIEDVISGFGYGANDYLTKPVLRDELLSRVKTHLDLLDTNRNLESRVVDRTRHLLDVQKELLEEAHTAGMAEIAVDVLHNIGNRLNSISTSVQMLETTSADRKYLDLLKKISAHWCDEAGPPSDQDENQKFGSALERIAEQIDRHYQLFERETYELNQHMAAMRAILMNQQEFTQNKGMAVALDLNDLVIESLHMASVALEAQDVDLDLKLCETKPKISVNRARFIRMFLCLCHNAAEAVREKARPGLIQVETSITDQAVQLQISDNGVGIAAENMVLIFGHGFTTKENRRGFGLHYSANAVKEMNGAMDIKSDGPGKGAQVTLTFQRAEGAA